jgi:hypothetical protein
MIDDFVGLAVRKLPQGGHGRFSSERLPFFPTSVIAATRRPSRHAGFANSGCRHYRRSEPWS